MESKREIFDALYKKYPDLSGLSQDIESVFLLLKNSFSSGGTLYVCGNGGSGADAEHIVGELMKSFKIKRKPNAETYKKICEFCPEGKAIAESLEGALPAVSLGGDRALSSAFLNDVGAENVYAQQLYGLAKEGDVLLCISTSGNAVNCYNAAVVAHALGVKVALLSGKTGGKILPLADAAIVVKRSETYFVQEAHLPIYHAICAALESEFFAE